MFTSMTLIPQTWIYVYYFTLITSAVLLIGLLALWIFPSHYKKVALLFGITGLIQINISGLAYYPYRIYEVFPFVVGLLALIGGALIVIFAKLKRKTVKNAPDLFFKGH
jgi:hypothetical protein